MVQFTHTDKDGLHAWADIDPEGDWSEELKDFTPKGIIRIFDSDRCLTLYAEQMDELAAKWLAWRKAAAT